MEPYRQQVTIPVTTFHYHSHSREGFSVQEKEFTDLTFFSLQNDLPYEETGVVLGKGSFSTVKLVKNNRGEEVALKTILLTANNLKGYLGDILAARLPPNPYCAIPTNVAWALLPSEYQNPEFLVQLSYDVYNGSLADLMKEYEKDLSPKDRIIQRGKMGLLLFVKLLPAIYFLLENGIYYTDFRLENIFYLDERTPENPFNIKVVLGDFGFTKMTPCFSSAEEKNFLRTKLGGNALITTSEQRYQLTEKTSMFGALATLIYYFMSGSYERLESNYYNKELKFPFVLDNYLSEGILGEKERKVYWALKNVLVSSIPQLRMKSLAMFPSTSEIPPRTFIYSNRDNVLARLDEFNAKDPEFPPFTLEDVFFSIFLLTVPSKNSQRSAHMIKGFLRFIKVIDCLSRYLVEYPFSSDLPAIFSSLVNLEIFPDKVKLHEESLDILVKLDFTIFSCKISPAFFCLRQAGTEEFDTPFDFHDLYPQIISDPRDLFLDPGQVITDRLLDLFPQWREDCQHSSYESEIEDLSPILTKKTGLKDHPLFYP